MTHTKGDWVVDRRGSQRVAIGAGTLVYASDSRTPTVAVAVGGLGAEEEAANAYLISAAPAMLKALRMVRDADDDCKKDGLKTMPSTARMTINQAIAKAEGTLAHS